MRKLIGCASAAALAVLITGCVGPMGQVGGAYGGIYTDVSGPLTRDQQLGSQQGR